jgi:hypothetical protein
MNLPSCIRSLDSAELATHLENSVWYSYRPKHGTSYEIWEALSLQFPESGIAPVIVVYEFEDWILDDPDLRRELTRGPDTFAASICEMERESITEPFQPLGGSEDSSLLFLLPSTNWAEAIEYLPIQMFPTPTIKTIVDHFEAQVFRASGWWIELVPKWKPTRAAFPKFCEILTELNVTSPPSYEDRYWWLEFR